jgi:SNF2 family DNA or RNA helicase
VHRAWKLLAPIILRRRKESCGETIVPKRRHVVRIPLGLSQAAAYQFHLKADYRDKNGMKAVGAQLQALRMAAANPASELLKRPDKDVTPGNPRSKHSYIPKVATAVSLISAALERHEQVIIGSAFHDSLDALSARLKEAGVRHLVLDGRVTQAKRAQAARLFKAGPPRAVAEGLVGRCSAHPVMLAGVECMAELHNFHLCNNVMLMAYS